MKSFKCTDGFVEKTISAVSEKDAAEKYAIVSSVVDVVEVDADDMEIGKHQKINVTINE